MSINISKKRKRKLINGNVYNVSQSVSLRESDPIFTAWNKSDDISISYTQIYDASIINKPYVDGSLNNKVSKTGDTMTGKLILSGHGSQKLMMSYSSIGFAPVADSITGNLVMGQWEDYFLDLTNGASGSSADATVFRINANTNTGKEATLALVRGKYPNIEFLDFYNNGYTDSSNYGIRIQKRGTGEYRDFRIDQYDGTTRNPLMMIKTNGYVGIGNNEPNYKLDVSGNFRVKTNSYFGGGAEFNTHVTLNQGDLTLGEGRLKAVDVSCENLSVSNLMSIDSVITKSITLSNPAISTALLSIGPGGIGVADGELHLDGQGGVFIDSYLRLHAANTATNYMLYYDPTSDLVTYGIAPSVASITAYVDGSLSARDTSIEWIKDNMLSLTNNVLNVPAFHISNPTRGLAVASTDISNDMFTLDVADGELHLDAQGNVFVDSQFYLPEIYNVTTNYILYYDNALGRVTYGLAPSVAPITAYVDGSLSARDTSINWLNANKLNKSGGTVSGILSVDMLSIAGPNNNSTEYILYYDIASGEVTYADAPVGNVTKTYVDSSLAKRDTSIAWLNSNKLNITGGTLTGSLLVTDNVTMDRLYLALPAQATTNYVLYYSDIDGQVYYDNKPVIDVTKSYVDGSLSTRDTSINWLKTYKLNTTGGTLSGNLNGTSSHWTGDVSVVGKLYQGGIAVTNKSYVDASVAVKADKNATISYKTSTYTLQAADDNYIIEASGTFSIYLPTGVQFPIGFQATIVNVGGGTIAINASTGATVFSRDSSNDLRKTWSGATVYKRSSTQWVAMGDLQ